MTSHTYHTNNPRRSWNREYGYTQAGEMRPAHDRQSGPEMNFPLKKWRLFPKSLCGEAAWARTATASYKERTKHLRKYITVGAREKG